MGKIVHIVYANIITKITIDDGGIEKSYGQPESVKLERKWFQFANPDQAKKTAAFNKVWIKLCRDQDIVPIVRWIVVPDKDLQLWRL